jgi:negative regulator of replication initiation
MLTTKALGEGMSAIQRKMTKHDNEKQTGKTVTAHHVSTYILHVTIITTYYE